VLVESRAEAAEQRDQEGRDGEARRCTALVPDAARSGLARRGTAAGNTGAHGVGVAARDGAVVAGRRGVLGGDRKGGLDPLWEGEHDAVRRRPWGLDAVARSATAVGVGATGTEPVLARVGLAQLWPLLGQHLIRSRDSLAVVDERRADLVAP